MQAANPTNPDHHASAVAPAPSPPLAADDMAPADAAHALGDFLGTHARVFVLTGAGISTASGIPDYRGPDGLWKRSAPITYQAFMRDPLMRARYWARGFVGWPLVAQAQPNAAHAALAALERSGRLAPLVTQNVDGLHERAGHAQTIDLHGRIDRVICLQCGVTSARDAVQERLARDNPAWASLRADAAPDGDADLHADFSHFRAPDCERCGGLLKPDVVFFGENVPRATLGAALDALSSADAMLVVGSSLMVYSGFRFARLARERRLPLALLTRGVTRADDIATLKLDADCVPVLTAVGA